MERIAISEVSNKNVNSTYYIGGVIYTHNHCLQVYGSYCDKYGIKPDEKIHLKTAKEIFHECYRIYNQVWI